MRSDDFSRHLTTFTRKLADENPWTRSLAFLTLRALLEQLTGAHQLQSGKLVLDALALESLPSVADLTEDQSVEQVMSFSPFSLTPALILRETGFDFRSHWKNGGCETEQQDHTVVVADIPHFRHYEDSEAKWPAHRLVQADQ